MENSMWTPEEDEKVEGISRKARKTLATLWNIENMLHAHDLPPGPEGPRSRKD